MRHHLLRRPEQRRPLRKPHIKAPRIKNLPMRNEAERDSLSKPAPMAREDAARIGGMRKRAEQGRGRTVNPDIQFAKAGAGAQNRTVDLLITNQLLYP